MCVPGGGSEAIDHEVDGLSGPQLDPLSQHVHELGHWREGGNKQQHKSHHLTIQYNTFDLPNNDIL